MDSEPGTFRDLLGKVALVTGGGTALGLAADVTDEAQVGALRTRVA